MEMGCGSNDEVAAGGGREACGCLSKRSRALLQFVLEATRQFKFEFIVYKRDKS